MTSPTVISSDIEAAIHLLRENGFIVSRNPPIITVEEIHEDGVVLQLSAANGKGYVFLQEGSTLALLTNINIVKEANGVH